MLYNNNSYEIRGSICSPDFLSVRPTFRHNVCMWHFPLFYPRCLLHLGVIPPSYFSQITGVIAEKWFVPVSFLDDNGKRARTAKAHFALWCLLCFAFAKIVRGLGARVYPCMLHVVIKNNVMTLISIWVYSSWKSECKLFSSMALSVENDRYVRSQKNLSYLCLTVK